MKLAKQDLIAALRLRYDHYSATSIFEATIARAGLADQTEYDAQQVAAFRTALRRVGDRLINVEARLDSLIDEPPPSPPPGKEQKVEAKPEPKPETKPEPKVEKKPEAKVIETTIALAGVPAGDGEQILLCGAGTLLGDWNPEKAPAMKREGETWLATVKVPADIDVAFKFLRRTPDGKVIWESGDDRKLVAKPRIDATWRST